MMNILKNLIKNIFNRIKSEIAYRKKLRKSKDEEPYIYK